MWPANGPALFDAGAQRHHKLVAFSDDERLIRMRHRGAISRKRFQISSDGWEPYEWAIEAGLSDVASYRRIVKVATASEFR